MKSPLITVLMPVYNGESYLRPALESILAQTCTDFELLIIDDGSTDGSLEIYRSYTDPRIRLVENGRNLGLIATLNRGLELAAGAYLARMDCDDISFPRRLERQLELLDSRPEVGLCGTWYEKVSPRGTTTVSFPTTHDEIRFCFLFDNPVLHSSVLIRRSLIEAHGLRFDPDYPHSEDYELWSRCATHTKLANVPEVLVRYREHSDNVCSRFKPEQGATADRIRRRQLEALAIIPDPAEIRLHNVLTKFEFSADRDRLEQARAWLEKLIVLGCRAFSLPETRACEYLSRYWYAACGKCAHEGLDAWRMFRSSPLGKSAQWEWQWKLFLRCLARQRIT